MTRLPSRLGCAWWALLTLAAPLNAQPAEAEFFETKIRPVLASQCYACHASSLPAPMGELALDSKAGLLRGGASGPAVMPGDPAGSLLLRALHYSDLRLKMPPTGKLSDGVIADFEQWIASGAFDPRTETPAPPAPAAARGIDFEKGRSWWAFQPVREKLAPVVKNPSWPRTKIDSFVLAKLEQAGLQPSAEADARILIRRAYLDLVGLKPSYEEVEAFAADPSPDRYEKLLDRLLASPQYGERWGRYWLDVARYGENADGLVNRNRFPYAWRYRDWVIEALNKDVPYDRFVKLQLAADHLPGTARSDLRALGYLGVAPAEWKEFKLAKEMFETVILDDWDERVDAVSRGLLGLTVACARCHDHKFDPISTKDYYAVAGVFASTAATTRPVGDLDPAAEIRFLWSRQRLTDLNALANTLLKEPGLQPELSAKKVAEWQAEIAALKTEMTALRERYPELSEELVRFLEPPPKEGEPRRPENPAAPFMNAVYDAGLWLDGSHPDVTLMDFRAGQARDLPVFHRGNAATPGEIVPRRFLTVLSKNPDEVFRRGSGRLDLAEKIFTDAAPLAARVMVNRVWGWHFDKHLVPTPGDFGDRGEKPSHPELLDDLAARFIARGWSLKWLHREIMLSAAYRQSSRPRPEAMEADPGNWLLWRLSPRRIDIEAYRDVLLQSAGLLDLGMHGPSLDLDALENTRRTVYSRIGRGATNELLRMYDFPTPFQTSPKRELTVTPVQQLFVMNSAFIEHLGAALVRRVEHEPDPSAKVRGLYRHVLARDPSAPELDAALTYLNRAPLERFAQILLATNEESFWP